MKEDVITITIKGNKKFRQKLVDIIHEQLIEGDLADECAKSGCEIKITSTLEPTWDELV